MNIYIKLYFEFYFEVILVRIVCWTMRMIPGEDGKRPTLIRAKRRLHPKAKRRTNHRNLTRKTSLRRG